MTKYTVSILCLFITNINFGQTTLTQVPQRFIEMTGHAEIEVVPDEIYLKITLREKLKKQDNAELELKEVQMKQVLLAKGIDLKNLSLLNEYSGFIQQWKKTPSILKTKDFILKLSDATKVGIVFQELDKIEIEDVSIHLLKHSRQDSLKKEMRIQAIKAAKTKIDYLLTSIEESKDKIMEVREINDEDDSMRNINQGRSNNSFNYNVSTDGGFESMETQFKKIKISAMVYLKYGLK
jgi:uncharacterized protein